MSEQHIPPNPASNVQEYLRTPQTWQRVARTVGAYAMMATAGATLGVGVGTTLMPVESKLGPHRVEATLNMRNQGVLDLGAPGSFIKHHLQDSTVPVGVNVVVKEIPYTGSSLDIDDVVSYASFFDAAGRDAATQDMLTAFKDRISIAGGVGGTIGLALAALRTGRRRHELQPQVTPPSVRRRRAVAAIATTTLVVVTGSQAAATAAPPKGDPTLEALGIHDVEVQGALLKTLLEKYSDVAQTIKATDIYYADIGNNVVRSYDELIAIEKADPESPYSQYASRPHKLLAVVSDMHCNTPQAAQMGRFADHAGAQHIIDAGDRTISGYPFEKRCFEALANHTKAKRIVALGNHDSPDVTAQQSKDLGEVVLDDAPETVDGIIYFGGKDRNRSLIGQGTKQWGSESTSQHGVRLAEQACQSPRPHIAAVHDPAAAQKIAETGCIRLVIAGHEHTYRHQTFTTSNGTSELQVMGSTGGAAGDKMTIASKLGQEAHMKLLVLDEHNTLLYARNIFMNPNKQVRITTETFVPAQPPLVAPLAAKPN